MFISPADPRWNQIINQVEHDVYHSAQYTAFASSHEQGQATAFYAEAEDAFLFVPLLLRELPCELEASSTWQDAKSAYGYPAPLMANTRNPLPLLTAFRNACRESGIVTVFIRLHPLISLPLEQLAEFGQLVKQGNTIYIDLDQSSDAIVRGMRKSNRRDIKKLNDMGFRVELNNWAHYTDFIAYYQATMQRVEASPLHLFPDEYFSDIVQSLGESLHLCTVLSPEGDVACAGLFMETNGIIQYHLSGTNPAYLPFAPTKLMLDFMWRWGKDQRCRYLHLGGGLGAQDDSLFRFKKGFSKLTAEYFTYRMVIDKDAYDYLNLVRKKVAKSQVAASDQSAFFPEYRMRTTLS